jgi:thioredoxin-related protein
VARAYERIAETYDKAVFLKLLGNANASCKALFKEMKIRSTPSFLYFRGNKLVHASTGAIPRHGCVA